MKINNSTAPHPLYNLPLPSELIKALEVQGQGSNKGGK